jgi:hypothetical protein
MSQEGSLVSFSTDLARLVAKQIDRLVTLNRHQLAGQAANLDFWLGKARNAVEVIDGYGRRFGRLKAAHADHVARHRTTEFLLDDPCCTQTAPAPPRRVPERELWEARRALCDSAERLLARCRADGLIDDVELARALGELGLGGSGSSPAAGPR